MIRAPITAWPLSWPDIQREVLRLEASDLENADLASALRRVQSAAARASYEGASPLRARVSAAEPAVLRSFAATPREPGEATLASSWLGSRLAANLSVTVVADSEDDKSVRLDGSYLGVTLGNWMIFAGAPERWWGPGWEGSLILSSNARPIPGVSIERKYSDPPGWALLRWVGPWRASASMGQMEGGSVGVPDVRFFAARLTFRPREWLEVGLSRTAQWCGEGRPCDLDTFIDLLAGRDNRDAALPIEREPGNQMAGYDLRIRSPWARMPVSLYSQFIGEDEAGGLPSKFLGLMGAELWGRSALGSYRVFFEHADTACSFTRGNPQFDCAYRSGLYPQGYTFRGRAIGHALGGDGRMYSLGAMLVRPAGSSWLMRAWRADLNRDAIEPEPGHPVSLQRDELKGFELQYNRAFAWGELAAGFGVEDHDGPQPRSEWRGYLGWRQRF